jgi:hypothetical protein
MHTANLIIGVFKRDFRSTGRDAEDKGTSPSLTGSEAQDTHYTVGLQQKMHDLDCSRGDSERELARAEKDMHAIQTVCNRVTC